MILSVGFTTLIRWLHHLSRGFHHFNSLLVREANHYNLWFPGSLLLISLLPIPTAQTPDLNHLVIFSSISTPPVGIKAVPEIPL
ncbi:hypothetical protein CS542_06385 [Pedobacter sp. IW39]|nr:hypothetical protein CS542_06385 [Pedobacter sp. IW39]